MTSFNYPPHVTLAAYDRIPEDQLRNAPQHDRRGNEAEPTPVWIKRVWR